jgi:hypothetical protein
MATIPNHSHKPFEPAAVGGAFGAAPASGASQLVPPRAALPAEEVERLSVYGRLAMLQTARPGDLYHAIDRRAQSSGISVPDMVSASVAQAVARMMRAP